MMDGGATEKEEDISISTLQTSFLVGPALYKR